MIEQNFIKCLEEKYKEYWVLPIFSNYEEGVTYSYAQMAQWIAKVHLILEHDKIKRGDKVALIGKDCAEWCMTWMGIITYGAVVVPILPQFHSDDILHIINHSDSRLVFAGNEHRGKLSPEALPEVLSGYSIQTLAPIERLTGRDVVPVRDIESLFATRYPNGFGKEDVRYPHIGNEELVLISYTSGTSGFSKGVMATANNLMANMLFGQDTKLLRKDDIMLCFLPNAHAYSCAFNFLLPQFQGTHVYILGSKPTPRILVKGLKELRPHLVISVPLILEKIYKNILAPKLRKPAIALALKTPILKGLVYRKFRKALMETFGGRVGEVIIGGAALNPEVEAFLMKIGFPITVGYGMTECSPIITYSSHREFKAQSAGQILSKIEELRIAHPTEIDGKMVGEVQVKGENVCLGYYKNREATDELYTEDGWMRTGDLGYLEQKHLYLKGRSKAMILSSDGQNIYPEEIEAKLAMMPYVNDAIVVQRGKKLVAILSVDKETLYKEGMGDEEIAELMEQHRREVNGAIARYSQIGAIELLEGEFEKTPKQSIKRYLYR